MTRGRALLAALAVAIAGAAVGLAGCGDASTPTVAAAADPACARSASACVTVGIGQPVYLGTLLYPSDDGGRVTADSVQLAVDYLDGRFDSQPGTLKGHDMEVLPEREDCTAAGGRAGARRLMAAAPVVAVIGTTCSASAYRAAAEVLSRQQVLLVSPTATSPLLTSPQGHDRYFFRTAANDLIQASAISEFARTRLRAARAATVATDDVYSRPLAAAFRDAFLGSGGRAVESVQVGDPPSPGAAAAAAARIAAARPDVVLMTTFDPGCTTMAQALRAQPSLASTPIIVSDACFSTPFLRSVGATDPALYGAGPDTPVADPRGFGASEFLPAYRRQFGGAPATAYAFAAFDATNLVIEAIRRTAIRLPGGALVINREKLRAAIIDVQGYRGLSGPLTCLPSGDCVPTARVSVYRAPNWPMGDPGATPVFSTSRTLAEVTGGG